MLQKRSIGRLFKAPSTRLRNKWMDDMQFYVLFNSISVTPGQCAGDNERLCAMKFRSRLKRSPPQAGLEPGTSRSVGRRSTY